jgi:hypothetical protein
MHKCFYAKLQRPVKGGSTDVEALGYVLGPLSLVK